MATKRGSTNKGAGADGFELPPKDFNLGEEREARDPY